MSSRWLGSLWPSTSLSTCEAELVSCTGAVCFAEALEPLLSKLTAGPIRFMLKHLRWILQVKYVDELREGFSHLTPKLPLPDFKTEPTEEQDTAAEVQRA